MEGLHPACSFVLLLESVVFFAFVRVSGTVLVSVVDEVPSNVQVQTQDPGSQEANVDVLPVEEWDKCKWTDKDLHGLGVAPPEWGHVEVHCSEEQRQDDESEQSNVIASLLTQLSKALLVFQDTCLFEEGHVEEPDEVDFEADRV